MSAGTLLIAALLFQQAVASRVLLATVTAQNRTMVDLSVDDFVVEEGGAGREVLDVHVADYPVAVVVDNGVPASAIDAIREAAARFVTRIGERAVAVSTLTEPAAPVVTFDDERAAGLAAIRAIPARETAPLLPLEAVAGAVRAIQEAEAPFSAIVVVSARAIDPAELGSSEALAAIVAGRIPVHVIALRNAATDAGGRGTAAGDVLREVASLTRGQYTIIYAAASFGVALDRLSDRMAAELMVQYVVPAGTGGELKVGVRRPGARVTVLSVSR